MGAALVKTQYSEAKSIQQAKRGSLTLVLIVGSVLSLVLGLASPMVLAQPSSPSIHVVLVGGVNAQQGLLSDSFLPSTIVIRAGDTVVWKDVGGPHTVTSFNTTTSGTPLFDSSPRFTLSPQFATALFGPGGYIRPGGSFVLDTSNLKPGVYKYQCTIHDNLGMLGYLTVTNSTASAGATSTVTTGWTLMGGEATMFNPQNLTVSQGTRVIFQSLAGAEPHNVVSETLLSNGTVILGKYFDSSPRLVHPGISEANLAKIPPAFPTGMGGMLLPVPTQNTFNYTFSQPGVYPYYCKIHSSSMGMTMTGMDMIGMVGEVVVLPSYTTQQQLDSVNSQVSGVNSQVSSIGSQVTSVSSQFSTVQSDVQNLTSQASLTSYIAYIAIGVSVVLGLAALALSRRRGR
jgi:plastocyanin